MWAGRGAHAGVLTSDPRIVDGTAPVPLLTYEEATELAFFGATVLHPLAMQPALQGADLAVRVKNSYNRCGARAAGAGVLPVWLRVVTCPKPYTHAPCLPAGASLHARPDEIL